MNNRLALIEDNKVINVIIGDYDDLVNIFKKGSLILETDETKLAWVGARWNGKRFEQPKSYASWTWNEETFEYDPPSPKPAGDYFWDEENLEWKKIVPPTIPSLEELIESGISEQEALEILESINLSN